MKQNFFVNENILSEQGSRRIKQSSTFKTTISSSTTFGRAINEVDDIEDDILPNVELTVDSDSALWAYENTND
jgi:hypothetical protein